MIISLGQLIVFLLILGRIAGVFIQAPIFSSRSLPFLAKTAIAVWLAMLLWFVVPVNPVLPDSMPAFVLTLVFEVILGFIIGFIVNIIFLAIQSAGEIIDMQMGLSVATSLDPVFGAVISIIGRMIFFIALIIFIIADGHHMVLAAFHQSFTVLPVGKIANLSSPNLVMQTISLGSELWLIAIKLSIPVVILIFISDFTFGIVSRVAPQVNVFMLGFQVKPLLGLMGILMGLPFIIKYIYNLISFSTEHLALLLNNIK
jgi:flagellar biosynthetic protein FliR